MIYIYIYIYDVDIYIYISIYDIVYIYIVINSLSLIISLSKPMVGIGHLVGQPGCCLHQDLGESSPAELVNKNVVET